MDSNNTSNVPSNFDPTQVDPANMTWHQVECQMWANTKDEDGLSTGTSVVDLSSVTIDPNQSTNDPTLFEIAKEEDKKKAQRRPSSANRALRNIGNM